jgi:hypothetical protein
VSIPLRTPMNFLEWEERVDWRPLPPCILYNNIIHETNF